MDFRWNEWNEDHATKHGVTGDEAEAVIRAAKPPYPEERGDEKWWVVGRGAGGRWIQVMYVVDDDDSLYIIHARPLTDREKRRYRRRMR